MAATFAYVGNADSNDISVFDMAADGTMTPVQTIASYDEGIVKDVKLPTVSTRPLNSVVQTISE